MGVFALLVCLELNADAKAAPKPGATAAEVRAALGEPDRKARQILRASVVEQWTYLQPRTLRVQFRQYPGEEPRVIGAR